MASRINQKMEPIKRTMFKMNPNIQKLLIRKLTIQKLLKRKLMIQKLLEIKQPLQKNSSRVEFLIRRIPMNLKIPNVPN